MQRSLSTHIASLEEKIVVLRRELRNPDLPIYGKSERELDPANAVEALGLFRKAYELEQRIKSLASASPKPGPES
ncbi:MAG TPA: hypothetical protein VMU48_06030 [Terracidiphilus sp.]|nr:hypothetical protein [Terracidiphilus sp.]